MCVCVGGGGGDGVQFLQDHGVGERLSRVKPAEEHLAWLRNYLRSELVAGPTNRSRADTSSKTPCWCSAASCWRIKYVDSSGSAKIKNLFVPRSPPEGFEERAKNAREKAEAFAAALDIA